MLSILQALLIPPPIKPDRHEKAKKRREGQIN